MHSKKGGRNHTIPLHLPFGYSTKLRAPHGCVTLRLLRVVFIGLVNKVRSGCQVGFFLMNFEEMAAGHPNFLPVVA